MITGLHIVGSGRPGHTKRWYIYANRGGPRIGKREGGRKPTTLTPAEVSAYNAATAAAASQPKDTLGALIREYRASPEWRGLAITTQRNWSGHVGAIEERWGETPLDVISDRRMKRPIIKWRDEYADKPRTADYRVGVLRHVLQWGVERGYITYNPAQGIPTLYRGGQRAAIIWLDEDVERFVAKSPQHIGDIVRLGAVTGLRAADLAGLRWSEVEEDVISRTAEKRSRGKRRDAVIPILPRTRALLEELRTRHRAEGVDTVLVNSLGRSWSREGLSSTMSAHVKRIGLKAKDGRRKHLHDLRGTCATALFAAGLSNEQVADILAWSPSEVEGVRHLYVDRKERIVAVTKRLDGLW